MAPSSHIIEQLCCIFKMSSDPCEYPLGILTAEHRDVWTRSRVKLLAGQWINPTWLDRIGECMPNGENSPLVIKDGGYCAWLQGVPQTVNTRYLIISLTIIGGPTSMSSYSAK